jgi:hypothetical protein
LVQPCHKPALQNILRENRATKLCLLLPPSPLLYG